ncbi:CU044_2847 family protein [Kitasatospora sp. NPDC001540]|uniref:CU044_2847 family protein n=1 Tax=Kitasatospora sp. NPDC001540 TaxID=3364014 RepID=UPI00368022EC
MADLVEFRTTDGTKVVVEAGPGERSGGAQSVSRGSRGASAVHQASQTFNEALQSMHTAAEAALGVFRDGTLKPDTVQIEFGVKLSAEAGAVIAKTAVEGNLVVKLSWAPGTAAAAAGETPSV